MDTDNSNESGLMRTFWGIDLPRETKIALGTLQGALRAKLPPASWPPPENFHLTLAFLGGVPRASLPQILEAGRRVAKVHQPFCLGTSELGAFPDPGRARILFLGLEDDPRATNLAGDLHGAMTGLGLELDEKPFISHLTLARFRRPAALHLEPLELTATVDVRHLVLFESRTGPKGSIYTALGSLPLG